MLRTILFWASLLFSGFPLHSQPAGFVDQEVSSGWSQAVGIAFDANDRMFVWEKGGKVFIENGTSNPDLFIDISEEVGNSGDHGLVGFALDPDFLSNGYIYLLYAVDRHHLLYFGTNTYDPNVSENGNATIGRLTRYTAEASTNYSTVDYNSRTILLGSSITNGLPILSGTHGVGSLVFATDGTLMVTLGDGASPSASPVDEGSSPTSFYAQGLIDGIITVAENVGAYRAQMLSSLNGKILRIDPTTGNGIPSNPYYDSNDPGSVQSRVWAMGIRNSYRMTLKPNTGSHVASDGNPGVFYFGDVGMAVREELNVCTGPGQNFGWPKYEGMTFEPGFNNLAFDPSTWLSPHKLAAIDWRTGTPRASVNGTIYNIGLAQVPGPAFIGNASTGGVWYTGDDFPAEYKNTYFHADYGAHWIHNFVFDSNHNPVEVKSFDDENGPVVFLTTHPTEGGLYYINYLGNSIHKISYAPGGNIPPTAVASANPYYGTTPLMVQFTGDQSSDPEFGTLTYEWDFGDGTVIPFGPDANPSHSFVATPGVPTEFTVMLTVKDDNASIDVTTLTVSVNNTPPIINSTSIDGIDTYTLSGNTNLNLSAVVTDTEHSAGQLSYQWQTSLFHDNHSHPEAPDTNPVTTTLLSPIGCDGVVYWYRITLTVTDAAGLSATYEKDIYPDCGGPLAVNDHAIFPTLNGSVDIDILNNDLGGPLDPASVVIVKNPTLGTLNVNPTTGVVTYTRTATGSSDSFNYTVDDQSLNTSNAARVLISDLGPPAIAILIPEENATIGNTTVEVNYELSGDLLGNDVDHVFLILDSDPPIEIHNLSGSYTLAGVPLGTHTLTARLADDHNYLTNPEAISQITFETCSPVNLALNKPASQSSTYGNEVAAHAVDGNTDGIRANGSITHTISELHAWWEVDLEEIAKIENIQVWNRTDCCSERLTNYHVFVSDKPFTSTDLSVTQSQTGVTDYYSSGQAGSPTSVSVNRTGRYIRVQLEGTNVLSLAELQVFGCSIGGASSQTITFDPIPDKDTTDPPFNLSATASSGLPVSYVIVAGPATVVGNTVTLSGTPGTVTIRASQAGDATYDPAPDVDQSFSVTSPGACGSTTNLALGKPASQSSTYGSEVASHAVDGNTDGIRANGSITHTLNDLNAWWEVDLGAIAEIEDILVWNRTDCCSNRVTNYHVFVSDVPFTSTDLATTQGQAGVADYHEAGQAGTPSTTSVDRTGRYVRIQLNGSNFLNMAEVQVMGCEIGGPPTQAQGAYSDEDLQRPGPVENSIVLYPNPAKDRLNVDLELLEKELINFRLYDLIGRSFDLGSHDVKKGKSKLTFDLAKLNVATGTYYLTVESMQITSRLKLYID